MGRVWSEAVRRALKSRRLSHDMPPCVHGTPTAQHRSVNCQLGNMLQRTCMGSQLGSNWNV